MAQDNTPAIVMYKGPQEDGYSIPFDKGYYGEVKVAFVRRGLTDYEYMPTTYTVDGALYAWEVSTGVYYYTKTASPAVDATVYNSGNQEISGVKVVSTQNASASFSDGKTGIRSNKKDIHSHALLFWTGEPLGNDDWICIVRETVKKQPYSYPNNQKHIEGALDNLSRQIQELKAQSDVSLKIDPTFAQDPQKMNPIDWLNTIVRSTDTSARGLRYRNFWLEYSTDDPNKAESDKSWTKLLNTTNVTTIRQVYNEETNEYYFQYSMDGGATWLSVGLSKADIDKILDEANAYSDEQNALLESKINRKLTAVESQIDANADAIQKTREDYIQADSEIHQILNNHAENLTTLRNDVDGLGDQVAEIESKIPESASATNHLVTKEDLESIDLEGYATTEYVNAREQEIRDDVNQVDSELQSQITAQASAITANTSSINGVKAVIPQGTSETNPLINKQQLLDEEMDIREDLNSGLSELQTQITAQAAEIATKQDQLTAGDNIVISNNVISATGAGGGAGFDVQVVQELPATGQKGIIYLLAKDGTAPDVYDEYVWITATQTFELIGTTAVDLTDYVKNTDYATYNNAGLVKQLPQSGIVVQSDGGLIIASASPEQVSAKTSHYLPIVPSRLDYAVKVGVTTNTIELTDEEKAAARTWIGAVGNADYATYTKAGIIRPSEDLATNVNGYGYLRASFLTLEEYNSASDASFIGKRTLENIKEDLVARAIENTVNTQNLTVGSGEGTLYIGDVAGTATIATNNGLDIAAQTKFDTAPTTDDSTTYADALDTSLVRKAQVATAIADAVANVDALPDQTGNAGKFLQTDGDKASWAEVPAGGTKVIIKRYS